MPPLSHDAVRRHFPALDGDLVFLENAGGSQVPRRVADAIRDYMLTSYVQLGAGYPLSRRADAVVAAAHDFTHTFVGDDAREGVAILGPSATALCGMLARAYGAVLRPGDNVVLDQAGHEANLGPWERLRERGVEVRWWTVDPVTAEPSLERLAELVDDRTRLVACVHVSNLLGGVLDLAAVSRIAHEHGARVIADGVAYAPHRAVDVQATGVDGYVFSTYKVYGPHMAALWMRRDALAGLPRPNHFFVPDDDLPYAFQPGGVSHEACAGWNAVGAYLAELAGDADDVPPTRATVLRAFERMTDLELPLQQRLVGFLAGRDDVRIVGPATSGPERVPTVSFVPRDVDAATVTRRLHDAGFAVRHGHMYAIRLAEALGLDLAQGVVRVSAVHYNTPDEIERLCTALDVALRPASRS